jgi:O-antigen/teichoic acid export membrane protein
VLFYLPTVFVIVQRPYLVRAAPAEAARRAAKAFRAGVVLTVPLVLGMVALAPFLCKFIFGSSFAGSVDDLRVLCLGAFGVVALQQLGNALVAQRRPTLMTLAAAVAFVVTIALDAALIPGYGGLGAAVASSVAYTAGGAAAVALFVRFFAARAGTLVPRVREVRGLVTRFDSRRATPAG